MILLIYGIKQKYKEDKTDTDRRETGTGLVGSGYWKVSETERGEAGTVVGDKMEIRYSCVPLWQHVSPMVGRTLHGSTYPP